MRTCVSQQSGKTGEVMGEAVWPRGSGDSFRPHPQAQKKEPVCIHPGTSPEPLLIPKDFIWKLVPDWPRITQGVDLGDTRMVGWFKKKKGKLKNPTAF